MDTGKIHVHYHIYYFISMLSHGIATVQSYDDMKKELEKIIQVVKDSTGSDIDNTTEYITTFKNGSRVRWQPCYNVECSNI